MSEVTALVIRCASGHKQIVWLSMTPAEAASFAEYATDKLRCKQCDATVVAVVDEAASLA